MSSSIKKGKEKKKEKKLCCNCEKPGAKKNVSVEE